MRLKLSFVLTPPALFVGLCFAHSQAVPTATANVRLSAFTGLSGNYTGVGLAKNADVVAGVDIGLRPFAGFFPAIEARGMYPINKGHVVAEENVLVGLRLGRHKQNFSPYGDLLFGRGQLNFANGMPNAAGTLLVLSNTSNVLSFGGGLDYNLSQHFAAKGDFQLQKYNTPVTASGSVYSKVFTIGIVYRIGTGRFPKR